MKYSLIIPVYNGEKTIAVCLEAALKQSLPREEYEVIVVDDGSSDGTNRIVRSYPVRLLEQEKNGPASARNRAIKQAKGDILIFTDSDCEVDFNFIEEISAPFRKSSEIVGGAGCYKTRQKEFIAQFEQADIELRYRKMARNKYIDFVGTYAAAYKKDIFHKYGDFDTVFSAASGEDIEFSYRLHRSGCKIVFVPGAIVFHQHPAKLIDYLKTKFYRGYWRVRVYVQYPDKIINDSYTFQSLKFQILSIILFVLFGVLALFNRYWLLFLPAAAGCFVLFSIPFFNLFKEKKYPKRIFIPFILFLRAFAFFLGILSGIAGLLKRRPRG